MTAVAVTMCPVSSDTDLPGETLGAGAPEVEPEETIDALPVLAEVRPIEPAMRSALPAVQAAAAAATGFAAGAVTIALVRRRTTRKLARTQRRAARRPADVLPIVGSRTFLVDVHLVAKQSE